MNKGFFKETEKGLYIKIAPWPSIVNPDWCLTKSRETLNQNTPNVETIMSLLRKMALDKKEIKILNLGHNQGETLVAISQAAKQLNLKVTLFGIDPDPKAARKLTIPATLAIGSLSKFNYKVDYFDLAIAFNVFEHLVLDDFFHLLDEVKKILKPDGYLYFEIPNPNSLLALTLDHEWWLNTNNMIFTLFSPQRIKAFLNRAEFTRTHVNTRLEKDDGRDEIQIIYSKTEKALIKFARKYLRVVRYQLLRHYLLWFKRGSIITVLAQK
jgi:SAM-dependent methyltransferase